MKRMGILWLGLLLAVLAAPALAQEHSQVTFVPARQLDSAARRDTAGLRPGLWYSTFNQNEQYSTGVVRRTFPALAEKHASWTDVWYVISGKGTLVTGGTLTDPRTESPGELRGRAIAGGVARQIAPGDMITVPAGVPHWVRKISSKEIVYLVVKIGGSAPAATRQTSPRASADTASPEMTSSEREVWAREEAYWRFVKSHDKQSYLKLWDERFAGWPLTEPVPVHKDQVGKRFFGGRKFLNVKLEPLSVREYGGNVVITFYRTTEHTTDSNGSDERTAVIRMSHTWMKAADGWHIVGGMSSLDTPAHPDR